MQKKSSLFILPYKDEQGRVQYADMSYALPHSFLVDSFVSAVDPEPGQSMAGAAWDAAMSTTGLFGTPVVTALSVLKSPNHTDPFTGRDLYVPGDSFSNNLRRYTTFGWNMAMPPWMQGDTFDTGSGGGIISDTFNANYKDEFGQDKSPYWVDVASLSGINFRSYNPEQQNLKNQRGLAFKMNEIKLQRSRVLKNQNIPMESKVKQLKELNQRIKDMALEIQKLR
jgi:hypothetical protein